MVINTVVFNSFLEVLVSNTRLNSKDWLRIQLTVDVIQKKIFYFSKNNDIIKVRFLQNKLFKSRRARLLSIYKIINLRKQFNFTGIDSLVKLKCSHSFELGLKMVDSLYSGSLRSIYFFKFPQRKNYMLFSSTLADRAKQELFKIVMVPEWEARFNEGSFGFITGKSCYDALYLIKRHIAKVYTYTFTFDVSKFFRLVNSHIVLAKINFIGFCKQQLRFWLKSFFVLKSELYNSFFFFTIGSIFIIIINIVFTGIDLSLNMFLDRLGFFFVNLQFIRYFNSFIIIDTNLKVILACKNIIFEFFRRVGFFLFAVDFFNRFNATFSLETISYIHSFNFKLLYFLGFIMRQLRLVGSFRFTKFSIANSYKSFLYPSKKSILQHQHYLHYLILIKGKRFGQRILIEKLNLIIKAWVSFFGNFNSNLTGHIVKQDYLLYLKLSQWVKRQRGSIKKGLYYWQAFGSNNWVFMRVDVLK